MGLASEVKEVSSAGVVRFDVTSLVGWREKQTLDRLKNEEFRRFQVSSSIYLMDFHFEATGRISSLRN